MIAPSMATSKRIGPYRVIQRLGAGGMGEVVLAHDDRLDRLVAIKRLHDDHAATPERRERFRREARVLARLNHPAVVKIHDVLHQGGHEYLIMEYVEGQNLRERCDAGPMTVSEVLGLARQIALGMAAAHDLGVIHRDLKAENILITRAGRGKLTDFGIATLDGDDKVTADGAVIGTFRAMSPEQALGRPIDHRSDLFSFGVLLYEVLAGESPFRAGVPFLTMQRLVMEEPRPIAELVPSIPRDLASLVHQLLAKEPLLRPRDFHKVADALLDLAGEAREMPCLAGPSLDAVPSPGDDGGPTADTVAPLASPPARAEPPGSDDDLGIASDDGTMRVGDHAPGPASRASSRRPWYTAAIGVAVLGVLGVGYAVCSQPRTVSRASITRVAVLASISDAGDDPDAVLLATAIRSIVAAELGARPGLDLVPWADIESYVDGVVRDTGRRPWQSAIRAAVGADQILTIDLSCVPGSCKVTLTRDPAAPGAPLAYSFPLPTHDAGYTTGNLVVYVSTLYPDHPANGGDRTGKIAPQDHARYVQLVKDYWVGGGALSSDAVLGEVELLRQAAPRSIDVLLFEADILRNRYLQTGDRDRLRRATALLGDDDWLLPDTYSTLSARFDLALAADGLDQARALLDRLVLLDPDSSTTHLQRAKLYHKRGELGAARGELDAAARRDPFSWRVLYYRARVFRDLGDRTATRAAIDQLLARSPGNYGGLSLLAREELDAGRLACAEQIYEQLVKREPLFDECINLGHTLDLLGRYHEAAESFHRALAIRPDDPDAQLDLAESLLLAGDATEARGRLQVLRDLLVRKHRDAPGGAPTRDELAVEAQTLAYLGRDDPASAAAARVQAAELLAHGPRPAALYTAALVHAYLGDPEIAARYATAYLDGGNSPADLAYPWFDDLRRDPGLGPRLAVPAAARTCEAGSGH